MNAKQQKNPSPHVKHILPPEERRRERREQNLMRHARQVEDWEDEDLLSRGHRYRNRQAID